MDTEPIIDVARQTSGRKLTRNASADKRSQIVDKAIELFNRHGYEQVKVSDITDALDIAKGTLYLYFRNKKELLLECFRRLDSLILTLEHRNLVSEADGFFEKTIPRFAGFQEQNASFVGILNLIRMYSSSDDPEIRQCAVQSYRAMIEPLKTDLQIAVKRGGARNVDQELAIYALVAVADSLCFRATLDDRYSAQEIREFFGDFVHAALRPSKRNRRLRR